MTADSSARVLRGWVDTMLGAEESAARGRRGRAGSGATAERPVAAARG